MSSTSDKPPRKVEIQDRPAEEAAKPGKTIRLKTPAERAEADPRRKPARWSPLQRSRVRQETPEPAQPAQTSEAAPPKKRPPRAEGGKGRDDGRSRRAQAGGVTRDEYANERPRRKSSAADQPVRDGGERRARRRPAAELQQFFAPCPRGLEQELARELEELGVTGPQPGSAGVAFEGDMRLAWKINLWSRLAIRVMWRVASGPYRDEDDLYQAALALPWTQWFASDRSIAVRTIAHACPLKSLNFVTLKIKDAVCDRFRQEDSPRPDVDTREPDVPIVVFLGEHDFIVYLDLSGAPLNRRGYRVDPAPAPLNENLAAGLLRLAGWTPEMPLLDPMMGGGTILLEAAMLALNLAPGLRRHFAFEHLANFDKVEWARLRKDAQAAALDKRDLPIYGCDIDPRMVRAAHNNLRAAGLETCVFLDQGDALTVPPPAENGMLISNPPYGVRLESEDMAGFYHALGDALKQRYAGWNAYLLSADPELAKHIGLKASRRVPLYNGPLECRLYEYRLVTGSLRPKWPDRSEA